MKDWSRIFFLLFIAGLLVYANSLNNSFLWDDNLLLSHPEMSQTKYILSLWDPGNYQIFGGYYRPLAHMVYAFCYGSFKNNYWQFHLLNLFFFVFLSSLVYLLIYKLCGNKKLAFLSGLFFLIHPINGIMVNNIVTSALTLQVIFIMGTILLFWESLERGNNRVFYFLSLFVSFLSLFWYDMGVLTPVYLAVVILIFRPDPLRTKAAYLLPFFMISFAYLVFRSFFLNGTPFLTNIALFHMTVWEYLATLFHLIGWYMAKLFSLQGIVMQWVMPVVRKHIFWNCAGAFSLIVVFVGSFFKFAKEKMVQLAIALILIGFAPACLVSFQNPLSGPFLEPHWFTFSSMGFLILTAYLCLYILDRMKVAGLVLLFIVIFAFGASSRAYNEIWANEKSTALFWSQKLPHLQTIHMILGDAYINEGNFKEGMRYYKLANHDNFITAGSCNNIGLIEMKEGHLKKAESDFKLALKIDPTLALAYNNLGNIYLIQGQWEKARTYLSQALVYDHSLLGPLYVLAAFPLSHSQFQQAMAWSFKNLNINLDDPNILIILIEAYSRQGDLISMKKYTLRMVNVESDPAVLTRLGAIMTVNNIYDLAQDCYTKALSLSPKYKNAYLDEGTLMMRMGRYDQAAHIWEQGSRLYPDDQRFKKYIDQAAALKIK